VIDSHAAVDPAQHKHESKRANSVAATHTFEAVALAWLSKTAAAHASTTQEKITAAIFLLMLRVPPTIHAYAATMADASGMSLNAWAADALAHYR